MLYPILVRRTKTMHDIGASLPHIPLFVGVGAPSRRTSAKGQVDADEHGDKQTPNGTSADVPDGGCLPPAPGRKLDVNVWPPKPQQ